MNNHPASRLAPFADSAGGFFRRAAADRRLTLRIAAALFLLLASASPAAKASDFPTLSAQRFSIDHLRSYLEFQIGFMKVKTVDGTFHKYAGTIMYVRNDVTRSSVSAAIETESIFTGVRPRDRHLRSADFFEVERYPVIYFQSAEIRRKDGRLELLGDLTMHGRTRRIVIPFSVSERVDERTGRPRLHVMGKSSLNRHDYGVYGNFWGDKVLSNEVRIEFNLEAVPVESYSPEMASMRGLRSLEEELMPMLQEGNTAAATRRYHRLRLNEYRNYDFSEEALLRIAAKLREQGLLREAREVVRLNLKFHPGHEESWDLFGLLQALGGEISDSISTYEKLLDLNRHNTRANEMLRWLRLPLSAQIR